MPGRNCDPAMYREETEAVFASRFPEMLALVANRLDHFSALVPSEYVFVTVGVRFDETVPPSSKLPETDAELLISVRPEMLAVPATSKLVSGVVSPMPMLPAAVTTVNGFDPLSCHS